jgi:hypothetical protein
MDRRKIATCIFDAKPLDEKGKRYAVAWRACQAAGIEIPSHVSDYFHNNRTQPDLEMFLEDLRLHPAVKPYADDRCAGYDVDISKLPPGCKTLRFAYELQPAGMLTIPPVFQKPEDAQPVESVGE